jgi:hypothetical protein
LRNNASPWFSFIHRPARSVDSYGRGCRPTWTAPRSITRLTMGRSAGIPWDAVGRNSTTPGTRAVFGVVSTGVMCRESSDTGPRSGSHRGRQSSRPRVASRPTKARGSSSFAGARWKSVVHSPTRCWFCSHSTDCRRDQSVLSRRCVLIEQGSAAARMAHPMHEVLGADARYCGGERVRCVT